MSESRGERVIRFIETYCKQPEGQNVGKPVRLEPFQKKFITEVYDNPYGTHTAILSIARKNGKTALIGGLLLAHLLGPEAVQNSQIVSGAQSKEQAAIIFKLASKMINFSPELSARTKIIPSGKHLLGLSKGTEFQALANEGKTTHGLSPLVAILDELGQVKGEQDDFVDAILSAQGAYKNPIVFIISTQAPTDNDMLSRMIDNARASGDPRVVCHVYEAPADCQMDDPKAWAAANPALGTFRSLEDVEKQCKRAMEMPANESSFRNLILNQRVEVGNPFVSASVWKSNGTEPQPLDGKKVWAGLDLSSVHDLTALVAVTDEFDVHCKFWLPGQGLLEKSKKDRVPYDLWEKQGFLIATPGRSIQYEFVAEYLRGFFDICDVQHLAFDRALFEHLKPWLVKAGFSEEEIAKFIPYGQGTLSMTPALRELEADLLESKLKHGNNPILEMCAKNAKVIGDSGARKFDKKTARGRIDGMVALAMARGVMPIIRPDEEKQYQIMVF